MMVNIPIKYSNKPITEESSKKDFILSPKGDHYFFTRKAFESFIATNHFDYHLRSYNPSTEGYSVCFGTCLTVFSCRRVSKSTLPQISAITISDSKKKIRFIRLSTKDGDRNSSLAKKSGRRQTGEPPPSDK